MTRLGKDIYCSNQLASLELSWSVCPHISITGELSAMISLNWLSTLFPFSSSKIFAVKMSACSVVILQSQKLPYFFLHLFSFYFCQLSYFKRLVLKHEHSFLYLICSAVESLHCISLFPFVSSLAPNFLSCSRFIVSVTVLSISFIL